MKLLGDAAVAMWWNVAGGKLAEFQEWHSKEHLPERMGIPGFNRGSRWKQENTGEFFVVYELDAYDTLTSDAYRQRLNDPTPWSTKMMPLHLDMVRSQCRVLASHGGGVSTYMVTLRLSPRPDMEARLEHWLRGSVGRLPERSGITGAHLLRTDTPRAEPTKEQRIRGGDAVADWIVLVSGYDGAALREVRDADLGSDAVRDNGGREAIASEPYRLVHAATPRDL